MLAKKHRLNLSQDENALIFKKNQSFFTNSNNLLIYLRKNDGFLRVTCIVPKKNFSKASLRNFYKRQLFSNIEELIMDGKINLKHPLDIVLVLKDMKAKSVVKLDLKQEIYLALVRFINFSK